MALWDVCVIQCTTVLVCVILKISPSVHVICVCCLIFALTPTAPPVHVMRLLFAERVATYGLSLSDITKCCVPQIDELIFHHMH